MIWCEDPKSKDQFSGLIRLFLYVARFFAHYTFFFFQLTPLPVPVPAISPHLPTQPASLLPLCRPSPNWKDHYYGRQPRRNRQIGMFFFKLFAHHCYWDAYTILAQCFFAFECLILVVIFLCESLDQQRGGHLSYLDWNCEAIKPSSHHVRRRRTRTRGWR